MAAKNAKKRKKGEEEDSHKVERVEIALLAGQLSVGERVLRIKRRFQFRKPFRDVAEGPLRGLVFVTEVATVRIAVLEGDGGEMKLNV